MALSGWSDSAFVEHGSPASLDDMLDGTIAYWLFTTSDTARQAICSKFEVSTARGLTLSENATPSTLDWQVGRLTTANGIVASLANFRHYAINKWLFVACTFDTVTDANNKFYIGDLNNPAEEPSVYTTRTAGSGSLHTDSAGNWRVGRHATATSRHFVGSIATQYVAHKVLPVDEIRRLQRKGVIYDDLSLLIKTQYGLGSATGTQADLTGNGNHGTVTGTPLVSAHVPSMRKTPSRYAITSAVVAGPGGVMVNPLTGRGGAAAWPLAA